MAPYVQHISLALMLMTVQILFAPVNNALGKPSVTMFVSLGGAIIFPTAFLIGSQWGLIGMAWAWLVAAPLLLLYTVRLSARLIGLSLWDIVRAMLPGLAPALMMAIGVELAAELIVPFHWAAPIRLGLLVGLGVALYGALLWTFERDVIAEGIQIVRRREPAADPA